MVLVNALKKGFQNGLRLTYEIAKVIVPIYIIIYFLEAIGLLERIASAVEPFMSLFGLPGELSLALVVGNVLNIYAALGVIVAVGADAKELTIISVMLLFSHSLPVELGITKKTGVRVAWIAALRIGAAIASGIMLNFIL